MLSQLARDIYKYLEVCKKVFEGYLKKVTIKISEKAVSRNWCAITSTKIKPANLKFKDQLYELKIKRYHLNMDDSVIRNMKDFQLLYNQISETCFKTCVSTFISRDVSVDEDHCIDNCSGKHINANHKIMEIFMEVQPIIMRKNVEEFQQAQADLETQTQKEQNLENTA